MNTPVENFDRALAQEADRGNVMSELSSLPADFKSSPELSPVPSLAEASLTLFRTIHFVREEQDWATIVHAAVKALEHEAQKVSLKGCIYVFNLLLGSLSKVPKQAQPKSQDFELLSRWADHFCSVASGRSDPGQAVDVLRGLQGITWFAQVPETFTELIEGRLKEDLTRLAMLRPAALSKPSVEVPSFLDSVQMPSVAPQPGPLAYTKVDVIPADVAPAYVAATVATTAVAAPAVAVSAVALPAVAALAVAVPSVVEAVIAEPIVSAPEASTLQTLSPITSIADVPFVDAAAFAAFQMASRPASQLEAEAQTLVQIEPTLIEPKKVEESNPPVPSLTAFGLEKAAADEFALLAEAFEQVAEDVTVGLAQIDVAEVDSTSMSAQDSAAWNDIFEALLDRFTTAANAARFMQVGSVETALTIWADQFSALSAAAAPDLYRGVLALVPSLWAEYFRKPDEQAATTAMSMLAEPFWPVAIDPQTIDSLSSALAQVQLIASRQIEQRSEEFDPEDLSLTIPSDADRIVVDNLLIELPNLSEQFTQLIGRITLGDRSQLEAAQRIAHTLKGSANTVGIRGIANLTHQLEDLFVIIGRDGVDATGALGDYLSEASDCLEEMSEAVVEGRSAPDYAGDVYSRAIQWTNHLSRHRSTNGCRTSFNDGFGSRSR
jgi:HPt (histidine-containing phosphotransfer) domain-containing protein